MSENKYIQFEDECVWLHHLPAPISVNDYANRRYPTKKKKTYDKEWRFWDIKSRKSGKSEIDKIRKFLFRDKFKEFCQRKVLEIIKIEHYWTRRLIVLDGRTGCERLKVQDSTNYIKATEDAVAKWLGIDDCYFKDSSIKSFHDPKIETYSIALYVPKGEIIQV